MNPQKRFSPFLFSLTCTFSGSALLILIVNLTARIESVVSGEPFYSDFSVLILLVLPLSCLALFIPVFLGVILLKGFLRYQLVKGWLTPKTGILSGIGLWGLGGIVFCLLFIVIDPFPVDPSLNPLDFLTMIPLLLDKVFLSGIAIACLVGGWAGHVLSKQILFDQQSPLAEQ
jgi:hypothetical protein